MTESWKLCLRAPLWPAASLLAGAVVLWTPGVGQAPGAAAGVPPPALVRVTGGAFSMGDVFGEGRENERPVHAVTLSDFDIGRYEVTVAQFRAFIEETGYRTSAEAPVDLEAHREIMERATSGDLSPRERTALQARILLLGGAGAWDPDARRWIGYDPYLTWRNPGFEQRADHPAVALSWDDAIRFCNWLSAAEGLPPAYDDGSGALLDEKGAPTSDVSRVKGYRLPTEAEWEYAARDGGTKVRFGNGRDVARSSEIAFDAGAGDFPYLEKGRGSGRTSPVGGYLPNRLGLYGMSGNAWEWVSDRYRPYRPEAQANPYVAVGDERILRGGRWGGDAFEARVFHRSPWVRNDRCNSSGFRVARSVN
jgi:formylglycine-generating enzyme required for sulfatase activity